MPVSQGLKQAHNSLIEYMDLKVRYCNEYPYSQAEEIEYISTEMINHFSSWINGIRTYEKESGLPEYVPAAITTFEVSYLYAFMMLPMLAQMDSSSLGESSNDPNSILNLFESDNTVKDNAWNIAQAINLTNRFNAKAIPKPLGGPDSFEFDNNTDSKQMRSSLFYWWPLNLVKDEDIDTALQWLDYDGEGIASVKGELSEKEGY